MEPIRNRFMAKVNWMLVQQYYLSLKEMSLQDVALHYSVSISTVKKRSMRENWGLKKQELWSRAQRAIFEESLGSMKDFIKRRLKIAKYCQSVGLQGLKVIFDDPEAREKVSLSVWLKVLVTGMRLERELYPELKDRRLPQKADQMFGVPDDMVEPVYAGFTKLLGLKTKRASLSQPC